MPHSRPYVVGTLLLESPLLHSHEGEAVITSQSEDTAVILDQLRSMRGKTSTRISPAIVGDEVHDLAVHDLQDYGDSGQDPSTGS